MSSGHPDPTFIRSPPTPFTPSPLAPRLSPLTHHPHWSTHLQVGVAKAAATVAAAAAIGPSVKLAGIISVAAVSAENETEAVFAELKESYEKHYARNREEAIASREAAAYRAAVTKEAAARKAWLEQQDDAAAEHKEAHARAAAAAEEAAAAAVAAETSSWLTDTRESIAALDRFPFDLMVAKSAQRSAHRLSQACCCWPRTHRISHHHPTCPAALSLSLSSPPPHHVPAPVPPDQLAVDAPPSLRAELDETIACAQAAQVEAAQARSMALKRTTAQCAAWRAEAEAVVPDLDRTHQPWAL